MPTQYCKRPIDLLGQHGARQFVRHGHRGERNQQIGTFLPGVRQTRVPAYQKDQIVSLHFGLFHQPGKLVGIKWLTCRVQQNLFRRGMPLPQVKTLWPNFRHHGRRVMPRPLDVVCRHGVGVRVFRLPDVVKENLQAN